MVVQLEGYTGCLVERTLDDDHIINLWLQGLKDHVELPAASTALVDHELGCALERTKGLESHLEAEWVVWAHETVILLLKEH